MTLYKWVLVVAVVVAAVSLAVLMADPERMKALRSVAVSALVVAGLLTISAGLIALYERTRR